MTTHPASAANSSHPAEVLVVEDNVLAADALRLLLETQGYTVRVAASVTEAVRACADRPVDLMLLDVTLPDGSGLDALAAAKVDGTTPRIIVALTGHDDRALTEACRRAGCREVLLKPIQPRELLGRVAGWLA
jgi:CheY-like chemotaxis protein